MLVLAMLLGGGWVAGGHLGAATRPHGRSLGLVLVSIVGIPTP
jgi:hypothetical protein